LPIPTTLCPTTRMRTFFLGSKLPLPLSTIIHHTYPAPSLMIPIMTSVLILIAEMGAPTRTRIRTLTTNAQLFIANSRCYRLFYVDFNILARLHRILLAIGPELNGIPPPLLTHRWATPFFSDDVNDISIHRRGTSKPLPILRNRSISPTPGNAHIAHGSNVTSVRRTSNVILAHIHDCYIRLNGCAVGP